MITITKAKAWTTGSGFRALSVEWDGSNGARQVVQSHPIIYRNGLVSVDAPGLPSLDALTDPQDDASGTLTVDSAMNAPQAAALALRVFYGEGEYPGEPDSIDLPVPSVDKAWEEIRG